MTAPPPRTTPFRLAAVVAGCALLLALFTIAFVDGPDPSHAYKHLVSVHDSLIPARTAAHPPDAERPRLEGRIDVRERGVAFSTWMFRWRGRWASVHRVDRLLDAPPQARVIERRSPERSTFDVGDLAIVAWEDGARTWVIAGSDDARSLLALSELVIGEGLEALSRTAPPPSPRPSTGAGPGTVPPPPSPPLRP